MAIYTPNFELECFNTLEPAEKVGVLTYLTEALAHADIIYLNRAKRLRINVPPLYRAGVRYYQDCAPLVECPWKDIPRMLKLGWGDCKDFTAWRIAELRLAGELDCSVRVEMRTFPGRVVYHVLVNRADGAVEDPSRILGMKG